MKNNLAKILHLETATNVCSVAVSEGEKILSIRETDEDRSHGKMLTIFMQEVLDEAGLKNSDLDAIAVSIGPGSYTGLRIGVSVTKGFAYASQLPVIAVPTLKVIAMAALQDSHIKNIQTSNPDSLLCPLIDARRMEVYTAIYNEDLSEVEEVKAKIIDENSFGEYLQERNVFFFGNGSDKIADLIDHENAHFITGITPSARFMLPMAMEAYKNEDFVDTAYFEPFYLKDFVATTSKKKMF